VPIRYWIISHLASAIAIAVCLATGCSKPSKTAAEMDASELLALFQERPQERQVRLTQLWPNYEKRARDAVISLVQRTETEHLCDPSLTFLKEEIAATINRVLQERLLIDVAFSDFSTDRETGMPWSIPPGTETKPPSGGSHGGHGGY
jgi:hypothetical protein